MELEEPLELPSIGQWVCYLLQSHVAPQRTYVGMTNHLRRRLRQHNGEIKGGARSTRAHRPWNLVGWVEGFSSRSHVLSFEHRMHRRNFPKAWLRETPLIVTTGGSSIKRRLRRIDALLMLDRYRPLMYKSV